MKTTAYFLFILASLFLACQNKISTKSLETSQFTKDLPVSNESNIVSDSNEFKIDTVVGDHRIKIYFDEDYSQPMNQIDSSNFKKNGISFIPLVVQVNNCKSAIGLHSGFESHHSGIFFRNDVGEVQKTQFLRVATGRFILVLEFEGFVGLVAFDLIDGCPRFVRRCAGKAGDGYVLFTDTGNFIFEKKSKLLVAPNLRIENEGEMEKVNYDGDCLGWQLRWKNGIPFILGRENEPKAYAELLEILEHSRKY